MLSTTPLLPHYFSSWKNYFHGRCIIMCTGPDLPPYEDLTHLDHLPVIGVNKSYLRYQPNIFVTCDLHMAEEKLNMGELTPDAWLRLSGYRMPYCYTPPHITYDVAKERGRYIGEIDQEGWIRWGSAPVAFQVAVWLGFTEIIFLGMPLHARAGLHFYPNDEFDTKQMLKKEGDAPKNILLQREYWKLVKPEIEERGLRVINCSLDAKENTTEKIPFKELF